MLEQMITIDNLLNIYETEIVKNVKNKKKLYQFEKNKMANLLMIKEILILKAYDGGRYNLFLITKPKLRLIMSQNISDKIINHFVTRYVLEPNLTKFLINNNTATRKNMGTSYALKMFKTFLEKNKPHKNIYVLKFDLEKYFYSIDHDVLKQMLKDKLTPEEFTLIEKIIDSTNKEYIKKYINRVNKLNGNLIPEYKTGKGIPIGNLTSQFLAIFYLSDVHKYIVEVLKLEYMICYMDDYVIVHKDKNYLKKCLSLIETKLDKEYKLKLNKNKTHIKNIKEGIMFLGYNFRVINKKTIIKLSKEAKSKIKKNLKTLKYQSKTKKTNHEKEFSTIMNYKNSFKFISRYEINKIIDKLW